MVVGKSGNKRMWFASKIGSKEKVIYMVPDGKKLEDIDFTAKHLSKYCESLNQNYDASNRVLLVQIPQFISKSFNAEIAKRRGYYAFPPTGLQCLYESLKDRGLDIRILDLNYEVLKKVHEDDSFCPEQWLDILKDYLNEFKPFVVGVSCMYDSSINTFLNILEYLKNENKSVVISGGVIASYEWEKVLNRNLSHFVIRGEGENKINYLFDNLFCCEKKDPSLEGIFFQLDGNNVETKGEKDIVSVDTDMVDSFFLVDIGNYYKYGSLNPFSRMAGIDKVPFSAIQMNRGCRAQCSFCAVCDFMGKGVRKRPVDKVLDEMDFLINTQGVRHFEWLDDDLLFYKEDFKFLLKQIIGKNWGITWSANNGLIATSVDEELMKLMDDSGCIGFKIGIETGNSEMLKVIKKPATLDGFRKAAKIFNNHPNVFVGGNIMLGFP